MDLTKQESVLIENLSKHFAEVKAVDGVSFEIKGGEFLTLLGPSGSGKTTLLNMIAGFFRPTEGEILIGGKDITRLPPEKRDVGMTFQNYALFPHMTVADNIAFPLRMRKANREEIRRRIQDVLALVRMSGYENRFPKQLSGGQQQRVSLARSIVFNPSLLLMDEPLGALDKKLRKHMQIELKQLHKKLNMTVVYVTHDQEEALTMSDRIAVMNSGRVEQIGRPDEIYQDPASLFVADFIGDSNFIKGRLQEINGVQALMELQGRLISLPGRDWMEEGREACLVLRPERLSLHHEAPEDRRNVLSGLITEEMYIGNISRYIITLDDLDLVLSAEEKNAADTVRFRAGEKVFVSWRVMDSIVVKA